MDFNNTATHFGRVSDPQKRDAVLDKLDSCQKEPALSEDSLIKVKAPAGSGKTTLTIAAIVEYRYQNINDKICAITFTRAAAQELQERLSKAGVYDVEVATIHVWARNRVAELGRRYRENFSRNVLDEDQMKVLIRKIIEQYKLKHRGFRSINPNIVTTYVCGSKKMDVSANYRRMLEAINDEYIQYKRAHNLYDFTDWPLYLHNILKAYNETINDIDALFIDEYQDVDPTQAIVFDSVHSKKKFVVGDAWQSIYGFRGCDSNIFEQLKGFKLYKLNYNYRSYQEIVDYATNARNELAKAFANGELLSITDIQENRPSGVECIRGEGGEIYVIDKMACLYTDGNVPENITDAKEALEYMLSKEPMFLCRSNKQANAIKECGYPLADTVHSAKGLEYTNVIVIDFPIKEEEELNVAYVAITRAKDRCMIIDFDRLLVLLENDCSINF